MSQLVLRSKLKRKGFRLDVDVSLPNTGITVLFGPSGSGKTTLLRALAGLEELADTELSWGEQLWQTPETFIPSYQRNIGVVFQTPRLFSHLNVEGNLRYGMQRAEQPADEQSFSELVKLLGLSELLERDPTTLSGGEQQRVSIARALLLQPALLLMDEPLSALDAQNKAEILPYLEKLHQRLSIPVVYVTHDIAEMARLGDYLILLEQGKVLAEGAMAPLLTDPKLPLANRADAQMQFDLRVVSTDIEFGLCELEFNEQLRVEFACAYSTPGDLRRVVIQAQDIGLTPPGGKLAPNQLSVFVRESWAVGKSHEHVLLETARDQLLLARITRKLARRLGVAVGETLTATINTAALKGGVR